MKRDYQQMYELCKNHIHSYVLIETNDGAKIDGIITDLDNEYVYIAIPLGQGDPVENDYPYNNDQRQFGGFGYGFPGFGGYGYPGYGYPFYGYGYRPRRRFRRLILPLAALTALSVLPWY